jgi:predicted site-specific integrase-resolvase
VNLKGWAVANGVHPVTAYRWLREGKLPVPATCVGGLILLDQPASTVPARVSVVYARVSSPGQRQDLERQVAGVTTWATGRNLSVDPVVTEVGPALDGRRRKLLALLGDPDVSTIVVEHTERSARFGPEYVQAVLSASGRRFLVVDTEQVDEDLVRDQAQILTSLRARRYGRGAAANRGARGVAALG